MLFDIPGFLLRKGSNLSLTKFCLSYRILNDPVRHGGPEHFTLTPSHLIIEIDKVVLLAVGVQADGIKYVQGIPYGG